MTEERVEATIRQAISGDDGRSPAVVAGVMKTDDARSLLSPRC